MVDVESTSIATTTLLTTRGYSLWLHDDINNQNRKQESPKPVCDPWADVHNIQTGKQRTSNFLDDNA